MTFRALFVIPILFFGVLFSAPVLAVDQTLPQWKEGYLDIHNIATGKGDATFIIMPDGTRMIIDAGDMTGSRFVCPAYPSDSLSPAAWIAKYVRDMSASIPGKPDEVDYFSLTHFHSDHMGCKQAMRDGKNYGLCGITELGEYIRFGKMVDRGYPSYDFPSKDFVDQKTNRSVMPDYKKFIAFQRDSCNVCVEGFKLGSRKQFIMKKNPHRYSGVFSIWNVAGNGKLSSCKGCATRKMYSTDPAMLDENMFSTVLLFTYGPFKYYNGGDIGGGIWGNYSQHRDFESQIADVIGPVTVMKADHHAWKEVLNSYFLWKTRPQAIVVQCSHINHPWKDTVLRLMDPLLPVRPDVYVTSDSGRSQVGEELFKNLKPAGHTVIRAYEGGKSYQVFVLDATDSSYRIVYQSDLIFF